MRRLIDYLFRQPDLLPNSRNQAMRKLLAIPVKEREAGQPSEMREIRA